MVDNGTLLWSALLIASAIYAVLIARRLDQSRHKRTTPFPSDEELLKDGDSWRDIDALDDDKIRNPTGKRYLVTGGFGQLGVYVVDLLWRRGERAIYVLDVSAPPLAMRDREGLHWIRCDITSRGAVDAAFQQARPDVVFSLAAVIRFWERASFTHKYSVAVNVNGTRNVLEALQAMPESSEKILVYCSSAAVQLPAPLILRLGANFRGENASYTVVDGREIMDKRRATHSYCVTKWVADRMVREHNGQGGLKTGVVRPGMSVCSPNDLIGGLMLRQASNPTISRNYAQNFINSQDLGACFLLYEHALRKEPENVGGDAFLVTGDRELWNWDEIRHVLQLFAQRDLRFCVLPMLPLYIFAHVIEVLCFLRYYTLLPLYALLGKGEPAPHPMWMQKTRLIHIMPAAWNTICMDVEVDDSRARKVLGYRNKFSNAQTMRWVADTIEAARRSQVEAALKTSDRSVKVPNVFSSMPSLGGLKNRTMLEKTE